jgi:phage shock protein PspC (stress-responsive transcriptional regulator)
MKLPYPIQPARVRYDDRDMIPVRLTHVFAALALLPVVGFIAYAIARLVFSFPN